MSQMSLDTVSSRRRMYSRSLASGSAMSLSSSRGTRSGLPTKRIYRVPDKPLNGGTTQNNNDDGDDSDDDVECHIEKLPVEVIENIFIHYLECDTRKEANFYGKIPSALCRVNRRWNNIFTPFLYSHFIFNGEATHFRRLWSFLRTVYKQPALARYVKYAAFTTSNSYDADSPARPLHPHRDPVARNAWMSMLADESLENFPWLRLALRGAGLGALEKKAYADLVGQFTLKNKDKLEHRVKESYHLPLRALILAYLPNLLRLNLHVTPGDHFLPSIVSHATNEGDGPSHIAFQKLNTLTLRPSWFIIHSELADEKESGRIRRHEEIDIGDDQPYHLLPALKDLTAIDVDIRIDQSQLEEAESSKISNIEKLTLKLPSTRKSNFDLLARFLPNVRHLSLILPDDTRRVKGARLYAPIWAALARWKRSLEYLDIWQGEFLVSAREKFCASLARFPKLKYLAMPIVMLGAYRCDHNTENAKIRSHMPPNLVSLALYTGPGAKGVASTIEALSDELENVAAWAGEHSSGVKAITFEDGASLPIAKMREQLADRGVRLVTSHPKGLFFGGNTATGGVIDAKGIDNQEIYERWLEHEGAVNLPAGIVVDGHVGELDERVDVVGDDEDQTEAGEEDEEQQEK
ncbi:hypothetical protein BJX70DRAFT_367872 [Aspergillus crustosus]